jgi:hypothetical protein
MDDERLVLSLDYNLQNYLQTNNLVIVIKDKTYR